MVISTKELCEKLGVSRSWVNKYLRPIGKQGPQLPDDKANLRTVYYDEENIVAYLNTHAVFTRQTEWLNLADHTEEAKARRTLKAIDAMPKEDREKEYWKFLSAVLPPGVTVFDNPSISSRNRGIYPWQTVKGRIKTLDELSTMATMKGDRSEELIYRENFECGRVRVMVHGRTWFMGAPELTDITAVNDKLYLLIPARGK